jgi:threonine synthase
VSRYLGTLRHPVTGAEVSEDAALRPIPWEGGHLYAVPEYDLAVAGLRAGDDPGVFRFRDLLPIGPGPVVSLGEGGTPLVALPRLGDDVGLRRLSVKDETRNPTASYKDRLAAVAVTQAVQRGASGVVVSSTGNHGASVAAYAARAGLPCVVVTLASAPQAMTVTMQRYGADVVALEKPTDRWVLMQQLVEERGWVPASGYVGPPSGSNPFGCEGYKTIAYELHEQAGVPDVVVMPVAYGDAVAAVARGFEELRALEVTDRVPRLVAAEVFGPYTHAMREGYDATWAAPGGDSVAFSIATPYATRQGWDALVRTGGTAIHVDDEATLEAQRALAAREGLFVEPSSATAFAALPELVGRGLVTADEHVVVVATSSGLKDVPTAAQGLAPPPVVEPTLAALDRVVAR